jgi:hypothetical protein
MNNNNNNTYYNPYDNIVSQPSINISGVTINSGHVYDVLGSSASLFPQGENVLPTDCTLDALIKVSNNSSAGGLMYGGSLLSMDISNNNHPVAQVMQDVSIYSDIQSYTGVSCIDFINSGNLNTFGHANMIGGIYDVNDLNNSNLILQFQSYYFITHIGSTITITFNNNDNTTISDSTTLSNSSNIGTYGTLKVIDDGDPFRNSYQHKGCYRACSYGNSKRSFNVSTLYDSNNKIIPYKYTLSESKNSIIIKSIPFLFYVDRGITPSITTTITHQYLTGFNSGIPCLRNGGNILVTNLLQNCTTEFFNPNIVSYLCNPIFAVNYTVFVVDIFNLYNNNSATIRKLININTTLSGLYTLIVTANSLKNNNSTSSLLLIDNTNGSTNRVNSGTGRYVNNTIFTPYDDIINITNTEELIYSLGYIQYPNTNFSLYYPVGPNYSNVPPGSYSTYRWITYKFPIPQSTYISRGKLVLSDIIMPNSNNSLVYNIIVNMYVDINNNIYDLFLPYGSSSNGVIGSAEYAGMNNKFVPRDVINGSTLTTVSDYYIYMTLGQTITANYAYIRLGIPQANPSIKISSIQLTDIS